MKTYGICYEITGNAARILHWVALARYPGSETHSALSMLHIEDGVAICTDGKRLHKAPLPMIKTDEGETETPILADGDYAVITSKATMVHVAEIIEKEKTFPQTWSSVIPGYSPTKTGKYIAISSKRGGGFALEVAKLFDLCEHRGPVNHDYLSDLSEYLPSGEWEADYRRSDSGDRPRPLVFRMGEALAVIMPIDMTEAV